MNDREQQGGVAEGIAAFAIWGFMPSFWKLLGGVPPAELLCHRMIWSLAFMLILLTASRIWTPFLKACRKPRNLIFFFGSSLCLGINWLTFLYGVQTDQVLQASLGYYINPLFNVALGAIFLKEKKRPLQWIAVAFATVGVLHETLALDQVPWIALVLAFSFGAYGLLRKIAPLDSLQGMALETAIFFPFSIGWLLYLWANGNTTVQDMSTSQQIILASSGVVTAIPLLLFAASARKVHLSTLGIMQYLAPSLMFLQGVFMYDEPFTKGRFITFILIWIGVILYAAEGFLTQRRRGAEG